MTDKPKPPEQLEIANHAHIEDISAPQIYADGCFGGGPLSGENITLTFVSRILDHRYNPPIGVTKTVLRLVLPRSQAREAAAFMTKLADDIEAGAAGPAAGTTIN